MGLFNVFLNFSGSQTLSTTGEKKRQQVLLGSSRPDVPSSPDLRPSSRLCFMAGLGGVSSKAMMAGREHLSVCFPGVLGGGLRRIHPFFPANSPVLGTKSHRALQGSGNLTTHVPKTEGDRDRDVTLLGGTMQARGWLEQLWRAAEGDS